MRRAARHGGHRRLPGLFLFWFASVCCAAYLGKRAPAELIRVALELCKGRHDLRGDASASVKLEVIHGRAHSIQPGSQVHRTCDALWCAWCW